MHIRLWQAIPLLGLLVMIALALFPRGGEGAPLLANPGAPQSSYDWLQFNFDPQHSGNNPIEATIGRANVATLHRLYQATLPDVADGAPVYAHQVSTPGGVKDMLFVTTKAARIIALDAQTGSIVWSHQNGGVRYTTSSPAIDPNRQYVYSYGLEGKVHKYVIGSGLEVTTGGWPETATLKPSVEKGSSALSFATVSGTTYLYVTNGGYPGDAGDYQGHVTAINLTDGSQKVFNANCSNQTVHFVMTPGTPDCPAVQTALWGRPGMNYDPGTNKLFTTTGNGNFNPAAHNWGDSVLALNPDGTGSGGGPLDSYTPVNFQSLQDADADLGSTLPAILPAPSNSSVRHLAVQGGKDQKLRLLNLDNLSGQGGAGHTSGELQLINVPQGGEVLTQPAIWSDPCDSSTWAFVATGGGTSGLRLAIGAGGAPSLQPVWTSGNAGTSPIVANNVVFGAESGHLWALDPTTGSVLWQNTRIGGIHWESPIIANGVLYITDENAHLSAYGPTVAAAPARAAAAGTPLFLPFIARGC